MAFATLLGPVCCAGPAAAFLSVATKCGADVPNEQLEELLLEERRFFKSMQQCGDYPNQRQLGSWSVQRFLSDQIDQIVRTQLPKITRMLRSRRLSVEEELANLGQSSFEPKHVTKTLFSLVSQFEHRLQKKVFAMHEDSLRDFSDLLSTSLSSAAASSISLQEQIKVLYDQFWARVLEVKPDFDDAEGERSEGDSEGGEEDADELWVDHRPASSPLSGRSAGAIRTPTALPGSSWVSSLLADSYHSKHSYSQSQRYSHNERDRKSTMRGFLTQGRARSYAHRIRTMLQTEASNILFSSS